ncbi:hypothetical protein BD410DRAFT_843054 [Rickenella mellea]|uniref:Uncharacterized protein n=1 Tax=Rickenella mellea TaxID=50990 RepID=A0A4Y7PS11_9AGAM|nr:hypothetical protein BD410DRAFT_843054 [Rickenella mellea]
MNDFSDSIMAAKQSPHPPDDHARSAIHRSPDNDALTWLYAPWTNRVFFEFLSVPSSTFDPVKHHGRAALVNEGYGSDDRSYATTSVCSGGAVSYGSIAFAEQGIVPVSSTPDFSKANSTSSHTTSSAPPTPSHLEFTQHLDAKLFRLLEIRQQHGLEGQDRVPEDVQWINDYPSSQYSNSSSDCETNPFSPYNADRSHTIASNDSSRSSGTPLLAVSPTTVLKRKRSSSCTPGLGDGADAEATDVDSDNETTYQDLPLDSHPLVSAVSNDRPHKKSKTSLKAQTSFNYQTTEPASARRAKSLNSSVHSSFESPSSLVTTVPVTPIRRPGFHLILDLPIIAPPCYAFIPRPPLSVEDIAEERIKVLLGREAAQRREDGFGTGYLQVQAPTYGIESAFRARVVKWLLTVVPPKKLRLHELRAHLLNCQETRFHAVTLFSRYFLMVGDGMPLPNKRETPLMRLGRERITWDVAVSCLAIAVKFHHDFLHPLSPIYEYDFLAMAPHPMSHDDFEISQKDVLEALKYEIRGTTPEPYIQELWACLPTMRHLLNFEDEIDMLRFPVSVLTAVSIVEGAIEALITKYELDMERKHLEVTPDDEIRHTNTAHRAVQPIIADFKDVLHITQDELRSCRHWMCSLSEYE